MPQIIPARRQKTFGESIMGGFAEGLPGAIEKYENESRLNKENQAIKNQTGLDLAGIRDPQTRHTMIANELQFGRKMKQAKASQGINYSPGGEAQDLSQMEQPTKQKRNILQEEGFERTKRDELPGFGGEKIRKEPVIGKGQFPQTETTGKNRRVLNPDELIQEGQRIAQEKTSAGMPTSFEEGFNTASTINTLNENYNQKIENERIQRVNTQRDYGEKGVQKILKVLPEASDELQAVMRRKGEEAALSSNKESDVERDLAKEAKNWANKLSSIEKSLPAPRLFSDIKNTLLGINRKDEKIKQDIRLKLSPLLKEGLYDEARNLLSRTGRHPEEREDLISDLGENAVKTLNTLPALEKNYYPESEKITPQEYKFGTKSTPKARHSPENMEVIKNNLKEVLTSDPSTNLVLLRKAYEDRGIDWNEFKDSLNDLILNGDIKLNSDQLNFLDVLEQPPLNNLDKILHGLKLIGR